MRALGAELRGTERGSHIAVTRRFAAPAMCRIGDRTCHLLAPPGIEEVGDPERWLFLDTETTGLSGGTGTYAFLVGLAWWEGSELVVEQLFMREHSEEPSLLSDVARRLAERRVVVTFNGKSFDWPLLETRFRMTRSGPIPRPRAHLDLLHPARRLWRFRLQSVALAELEREVLRLDRGGDIPSHTIPARYFEYLRGGPEEPIVEVFRHNAWDLRGLATLAVRIAGLLEAPEAAGADADELYGISRLLHQCGEERLAQQGYQQALAFGLPKAAERMARRELALLTRRQGDFPGANELWESLLGDSPDGIQAYEQLAIHYEHRARDRTRALALTRAALIRLHDGHRSGRISPAQYERWHAALRHRLSRLSRE